MHKEIQLDINALDSYSYLKAGAPQNIFTLQYIPKYIPFSNMNYSFLLIRWNIFNLSLPSQNKLYLFIHWTINIIHSQFHSKMYMYSEFTVLIL